MRLGVDHLRREVVECTAHGGAPGGGRVDGPAEVGNLQITLHVEEEVLGLDVPVDDLLGVAILEGLGHLVDVLGAAALVVAAAGHLLQLLVHLATRGVLQDEVDTRLVVEVAEHAQNVLVSKMIKLKVFKNVLMMCGHDGEDGEMLNACTSQSDR